MKNKKWRNIEKRTYELLGVNIFRKYVLFTWEKLWKLVGLDFLLVYRIENKSIEEIKKYKSISKAWAFGHSIYMIFITLYGIILSLGAGFILTQIVLQSYCIITQRYNHIRINETIEKYEELMKKREERTQEQTKELTSTKKIEYYNENVKEELDSSEKLKELYDMKEFLERENNTMSQSEDNSYQKGLKFKS